MGSKLTTVTPTPRVLTVSELAEDARLVHGFSTLELGSVGLIDAPDPGAANGSRRRFAELLGLDPASITVVGAVHGANVERVEAPRERVEDVDALITDQPGIALFATYADCYPIILWDPDHRAIGLAHAGWRGTEADVAAETVRAMAREFGSEPARMKAAIGPGICGRCYEVGEEVASRFDTRFVRDTARGKFLLDLAAANRAQLEEQGVGQVVSLDLCTKETAFLPSHRRTRDGARFGAIVAIR
jgi:YfiH family protein